MSYIQPFEPLPWQVAPWRDTSPLLLLTGSAGGGKLLPLDTPIPTPLGWKNMSDLSVGNLVLGADGMPTRVVAVSEVEYPRRAYEIEFDDQTKIIAGSDHQWLTHTYGARRSEANRKKRLSKKGGKYYLDSRGTDQRHKMNLPSVVTTEEISETLMDGNHTNHAIPVTAPVQLPEKWLPIPPYCLGMWLGDGHSNGGGYTVHVDDTFLLDEWERYGYEVKRRRTEERPNMYQCYIRSLVYSLRGLGVINNKRIPTIYLRGSFQQRIELLQGIVDTDGHVNKRGQVSIDMARLDLMQDIQELVLSLGIKAGVREDTVKLNGKVFCRYRMKFTTNLPVARLPRKRNRLRLGEDLRDTQKFRYIVGVREVDNVPMKCIQVDNDDSLYLCGNSFVPTHNSRLACEKIHGFLLKYPGSTGLILRKVRESLSNSTLLFLEREIIGNDHRITHRKKDFRFEYDNGSVLAYGGMKDEAQRERIRSIGLKGGIDIAWMEEATQFDEEDLNELLARMRGNAAPWNQIILTTNPDGPGHWIFQRLILGGEASVYKSQAVDNKYNPESYRESLNKLSGVQYRRLVKGEWAVGSGAILDTWEDDYNKVTGEDFGGNVTEDADYIPEYGRVVWSIDDGYSGKQDKKTGMFTGKSHPRAILACQLRLDGTLAVFDESFRIHTLATDHIALYIAKHVENGWALPQAAVRDRAAASLDGSLAKFNIKPRYNHVDVDESTKLLREYLAQDANKVRRIIVHPRCFHVRYEAASYSYDNDGRVIKEFDHGIDALRYILVDKLYGQSHTVDIATYSSVVKQLAANYGG